MTTRNAGGFSLVELLIVGTLFSLFLIVSYQLLSSGLEVWQRTSSSQDVSFQLGKARNRLCEDLRPAAFGDIQVAKLPLTAGGKTEDVLWFLTAVDPATGTFCRKNTDGLPFKQKNILYYLAAPKDHQALFGIKCASTTDNRCPHKFLIRRVFDKGNPTRPTSAASLEEILLTTAEADSRNPIPEGFGLQLPSAPKAESNELVATGILDWTVSLGSGDTPASREVEIRLSGFDTQDAGKKVRLGREDLTDSSYTHTIQFSVFPSN